MSKELTLQEKVFLVEIDSLDNDDCCYASNKHFAEFFGLSLGRVSQVINSLQKKGYIEIEYIKNGKEILKRKMMIKKPPYPIKFSKWGYLENDDTPIKFSKGGYLENAKENNTLSNNTLISNIKYIVEYLNFKAGTRYRYQTESTKKHISARLKEGFTIDDFKTVIDKKVSEWKKTKMEQYLRPETLFGSKFEGYLNQKINTNEKNSISSLPEWYANQDIVQPNVEVDDEELKRLQEKLGG